MTKKKIDLSDIKRNDLEETSTFTDLMRKKEKQSRKNKIIDSNDIDEMVNEKRKNTEDLAKTLEEAKEVYKKKSQPQEKKEEKKKTEKKVEEVLEKTQILELTRQMKFNFEEKKEENRKNKRRAFSPLNIVGELNLFCIGYYIYLLAFTNYQDIESRYMLNGGIIVLLTLLFGLSVVTGKKVSKIFYVLNVLLIFGFIFYNTYTLIN